MINPPEPDKQAPHSDIQSANRSGRGPQSAQSVPMSQKLNSAPGPPSSHSPSEAYDGFPMHVLVQIRFEGGGGEGEGGGGEGEGGGGDGGDGGGGGGGGYEHTRQPEPVTLLSEDHWIVPEPKTKLEGPPPDPELK